MTESVQSHGSCALVETDSKEKLRRKLKTFESRIKMKSEHIIPMWNNEGSLRGNLKRSHNNLKTHLKVLEKNIKEQHTTVYMKRNAQTQGKNE